MKRREFQFADGASNKFWAIELNGSSFKVHYGRVGTAGQAQEKSFADEAAAKKEYDKLIAEKTKKGYAEVTEAATGASGGTPTLRVAPVKAPKPAAEAEPGEEGMPSASTSPTAAGGEAIAPASRPLAMASATVVPPAAKITFERRIRLRDEDRERLAWLPRRPRPTRPPAQPFDLEERIKHWIKVTPSWFGTSNWDIDGVLTPEESWFWLQVLADRAVSKGGERNVDVVRKNSQETVDSAKLDAWLAAYANKKDIYDHLMALPTLLLPFFSPREILEKRLDYLKEVTAAKPWMYFGHRGNFAGDLTQFLSDPERAEFRVHLEQLWDTEADKQSVTAQEVLKCLARVGGGQRLADHCASLADATWARSYGDSELVVVAGLPDRERFVVETRRLIGPLRNASDLRLWLAATDFDELRVVADAVLAAGDKGSATANANVLALVEAPEVAPLMLEIKLGSKAPFVAADWLAKFPLHAAIGLVPAAMGQGKLANAAQEHLQIMRRSGLAPVLHAALEHLPPNQAEWVRTEVLDAVDEVLPELARAGMSPALQAAFGALKVTPVPGWVVIASLPPIKIGVQRLATAEVQILLGVLKATEVGCPAPLVTALKAEAEPNSLDAFAWKLFDQWYSLGAPSKDKWALGAIGHLGGDSCVLKLTPLLRAWPGESQGKRAIFGLSALRAIGTDTALMALNGIAEKVKFKSLQEKARALMEEIAQARGFTRDQLSDRIVPDLGLDARGSRVFDFGPRQFRFVLGPEMKPLIRDAAGKVRPDLPSPNSSDDGPKAEAAVSDWKLLKKQLRETLKIQAERLEEAMITGRRWTAQEFETLLLKHPLMINLVRQVVFAAYDQKGKAGQTFRATEDQTLADQNDDAVTLPPGSKVGVVHAAHLGDAAKSAWGQVLSDYEIIPPFQQIGRAIREPEPAELGLTEITRFAGPKIPGIVMYGMLERTHWTRDTPADGGGFNQHSKFFASVDVTAFIQYEPGLAISYYDEAQQLTSIYFVPGYVKPDWWGRHENKIKIGEVDRVVLSEVLRLAYAIAAKAA